MHALCRLCTILLFVLVGLSYPATDAALYASDFGQGFKTQALAVDGGSVSVTVGGTGPAVMLLHGYAETSRMWKPLATVLASRCTVIAPDLPGIGDSSIPVGSIDMTKAAETIHAAVHSLGHAKMRVVGHDIGLMVAYAYAHLYPDEVEKLVLMDAFLPGVEGWEPVYNNPGIWHFRFYGPTAEALVKDRERVFFEHFWNDFAADKDRSIPEADRKSYTEAYARPGRMAAGFAYFRSFPKTAVEFAEFAKSKLSIPLLTIGGDKSLGGPLAEQGKRVATNATAIVLKDTGHWIMEEQPQQTIDALVKFLQE